MEIKIVPLTWRMHAMRTIISIMVQVINARRWRRGLVYSISGSARHRADAFDRPEPTRRRRAEHRAPTPLWVQLGFFERDTSTLKAA